MSHLNGGSHLLGQWCLKGSPPFLGGRSIESSRREEWKGGRSCLEGLGGGEVRAGEEGPLGLVSFVSRLSGLKGHLRLVTGCHWVGGGRLLPQRGCTL